jgi:Thioredoxin-like
MKKTILLILLLFTIPTLFGQNQKHIRFRLMTKNETAFASSINEYNDLTNFTLDKSNDTYSLKSDKPFLIGFSKNFKNYPIIAYPEKEIKVYVSSDSIWFDDFYQKESNYLKKLVDFMPLNLFIPSGGSRIWSKKTNYRNLKSQFYDEYSYFNRKIDKIKKNYSNKAFFDFVQKQSRIYFLYNMIAPIQMSKIEFDSLNASYCKDLDELFNDMVDVIDDKNTYRCQSIASYEYNKYLVWKNGGNAKDPVALWESAERYFAKNTKELILLLLLKENYENIFYQQKKEYFKKNITNDNYVAYLEKLEKEHPLFIPQYLLDEELTCYSGEKKTFKAILDENENNKSSIYVDFWASWCGPCRAEMPFYSSIRDDLKSRNIKTIFISKDKDAESWKTAIQNMNMMDYNHYLAKEDSKLLEYVGALSIPHYILLSRNYQIRYFHAPKPSEKDVLLSQLKE